MKRIFKILYLLILVTIIGCSNSESKVEIGADLLFSDYFDFIKNKKIALVTNHTGRLANGTHLIDTLLNTNDTRLVKIFSPEHGLFGKAPDGSSITDSVLSEYSIPVLSLYGTNRKPSPEMLKDIDVIVFDIQDIGSRYYTYISTMYYCLEAAAENKLPLIILDRPNPIGGNYFDGPLIEENYKSFVSIAPIPIVHGMTMGELALLFNGERMTDSKHPAEIFVAKMKNWKRRYLYSDCGLPWIKPSPNMPTLETALIYPGLCLLEGTNISEGRGTYEPFLKFGSPYIDADELLGEAIKILPDDIKAEAVKFTPVSIDTMSKYPKYEDEQCFGLRLSFDDSGNIDALRFGIRLLFVLKNLYDDDFGLRNSLDRLYGSSKLRKYLMKNEDPENLFASWQEDLNKFKVIRNKYLLY
ncbi:MAG: DUF1343 domain-containing protein [Melioribacteraceae bacterium]|nr:DUF1343 domain-containing protein [Melioribacteraceae bacterium]